MQKLKPITEEQKELIDSFIEAGNATYEKLTELVSDSFVCNILTASSFVDSSKEWTDEEIAKRYRGILEGLVIGKMIGSLLALKGNPRESILSFSKGYYFHDKLADMFKNWDEMIDDDDLAELLQNTIDACQEEGIVEPDNIEDILLN